MTTKHTKHTEIPYDSNPFTISFRGFELMWKFASGIVIALAIFAFLNLAANIVSEIASTVVDNSSNNNSSSNPDIPQPYFINEDNVNDNDGSSFAAELTNEARNNDSAVEAGEVIAIIGVIVVFAIIVGFIGIFIGSLMTTIVNGTVAAAAVSSARHEQISFGQALSAMSSRFGVLYWANVMTILRIFGGILLFIVPGIRAALRYEAVPYIIMDDPKITSTGAVNRAKTLYDGHLMEVFGIKTVGSIIPIVGTAFAAGGMVLSYSQISAYNIAGQNTPGTHWLNYLGLMLMAGFALLIIAIAALVLIVFAAV